MPISDIGRQRRIHYSKVLAPVCTMLSFAALFYATEVSACAACGCTLSKDWGVQGINTAPGFTADVSYDFIKQNQQRYGSSSAFASQINNLWQAGQEVEDYTVTEKISAALNYTSDTWGISTVVPFVHRTHGTFGAFDATNNNVPSPDKSGDYSSSSDKSIGDISIIGRYTGFSADRSAGIIAGIKLPTGSTDANFNSGAAAGTRLDPSLQIGTGSTDILLGGFVTGTVDEYGWFAQGTVQHAVATKSFAGDDFHPGDTYALNTGIRHARFGARFTPMLQLNCIHRSPDTGTGATPPDALTGGAATGGTLVYLAPGALLRVGGGTSVYGFIQFPIYQYVNSLQLSPRYTVSVGVQQTFE